MLQGRSISDIMASLASRMPVGLDATPGSVVYLLLEAMAAEIADLEYRMCEHLMQQGHPVVSPPGPPPSGVLSPLFTATQGQGDDPGPLPSMRPPWKEKKW